MGEFAEPGATPAAATPACLLTPSTRRINTHCTSEHAAGTTPQGCEHCCRHTSCRGSTQAVAGGTRAARMRQSGDVRPGGMGKTGKAH